MTAINIATTKGSISGAEFEKSFNEITYSEVQEIADLHYDECRVYGWCKSKQS